MSKRWWIGRSGAAAIIVSSLLTLPVMAHPVYEAIVLDAQTGQVLHELNADIPTAPASLTKMMTLYLTFEALNQRRLRLDQFLQVSDYAASRPPSKLGLKPGEAISVQDLILGIVTKSANDAAVVVAEALGGSEAGFAPQRTSKARQLGMNSTLYDNASGLPSATPGQLNDRFRRYCDVALQASERVLLPPKRTPGRHTGSAEWG